MAKTTQQPIELPRMNVQAFTLTLVGDSPLICHAWSEKARRQMLDKQMKKAAVAKEAKDPVADFWASLYILEGSELIDHSAPTVPPGVRFGFPAVAFKSAAVDACSHVADLTKVGARGAFHIIGDMIEIVGTPTMREDMVRVGMGTADIRYRGEFREWSATLRIRHNANVLSVEQIVNLFNTGGFAIGVGEWRPQKDGSFGMFHCQ